MGDKPGGDVALSEAGSLSLNNYNKWPSPTAMQNFLFLGRMSMKSGP